MKTIEIKGSKREATGKKDSKKLRVEGKVPCVLYGGQEPVHFYANSKDFKKLLYTPNVYLVDVDVDGTVSKAIVQDVQFHVIEDEILHVDFLQLSEDKPIKIEIPIKVQGYAEGMRKGGKMKLNLRRLKVKALPQNLPDAIPVNIDALDLGQSVKVGELQMENIEFLNAKSIPVVTIVVTRAAKAAASTGGK
ncbi:MAG: 50S ribosomal protein L25/general stress protein Ctc [Bacteroidetes bacterium GWF2_42_66]|nr:MAG: 50S ribosomal protein L25/general stress protein Ctc [Bacteroidetes bacterium GWA2_42_15]OFX97283.1 MAG: 50S ribosomal protein L25/general stress protein Ctc [Bacteroidetes bacterium GWE2_42_39]OFY39920.1 MAG: 50S ribosomal protein L25/general stress protein Ctc [Bacteroidetes bacterium GWF2_42_66]HBL78102.1 50S ribosomal protein L25 [Prolixibacteraceae bacterium]HCR90373.1 50S ribosomal protein L25 [Prolixibacteraceae bacterium]